LIEPGQKLILRTDGAARGNPGPAAAGVVIEDPSGRLLARGKKYLGYMTNNQAEYHALILGLRAIARYQPAAVQVYIDSDLLAQQMNGRYRVRHPNLKALYDEARALCDALPIVRIAHVPRAQNYLADELANTALDQRCTSGPPEIL